MRPDYVVRSAWVGIALCLAWITFRPLTQPTPVKAESANAYPFYIEPGSHLLRARDGTRQVYGWVVVDIRNGKIWGFPTMQQEVYPVDATPPCCQYRIHSCWVSSRLATSTNSLQS